MHLRLQRHLPWLAILACLLPFLPGVGGPFLHDDAGNLAALKVGPFTWKSLLDAAFRNESGPLLRPLSNLTLAANIWLSGNSPAGYKLFNLGLHGLCGLALYAFLREILATLLSGLPEERQRTIALLTAMLWTLHPLQVSTALYVVQRMAQLSTLFLFLLAWRFQRYLNHGDIGTKSSLHFLLEWGLLVLLSMASKENGALAPLLMAVQWALYRAQHLQRPWPPRRLIALTIVLPLLAGLAVLVARPELVLAGYSGRDFTLVERLLTEAVVLWHYLRLWWLPWLPWMGLYNDIPTFGTRDVLAWFASAAWLACAVLAWMQRKRWPIFAFAVLWFLAAHAMESTILPLELVYEHRNYLAMPGMALLAALAIHVLATRLHVALPLAAALVLLILAGQTLHRASDWSSLDRFARTEFDHHPRSSRAANLVLSRQVAANDFDSASRTLAILKQLEPRATWIIALEISLRCNSPRFEVQWDELERRLQNTGTDQATFQMLRQAVINLVSGRCGNVPSQRLQGLLQTAYMRASVDGDRRLMLMYASYIAWLARSRGDVNNGRTWLRRASEVSPQDVETLFDLAYLELNSGHLEATTDVIAEIKRRQTSHPLIRYRIDELEAQLRGARLEQLSNEQNQ